ncbi:carboxylesterase family protein [Streptomyces sp. SID13726]|uniref:carboxylesterase/lipase family protein n=1 Tax=Streptomyces sp. SID13726 TaxID=2706058 RepID=UPI0013BACE11|nr:carboxylesterase family protein [Streptomyces sp. SID13726]NEB03536.1 carboxylesterase family protein [Streptomyces sp. SID13726]
MTLPCPTARTAYGLVSGTEAFLSGVTVFKGVPYGASTAGPNRWRPPLPPARWDGTRLADTFGPICPQPPSNLADPALPRGEDCLNLNIWTAAGQPDERLPVLVWLHGGRFLYGSGADPQYDGSALAAQGLVVVTVNSRLGVLGYLATPELSAESADETSGNYGLLDQIAALRWVRSNIAAFGGDPERVTIAGQSSGAASVMDLVYSPFAAGLFHGAVADSAVLHPGDPAIATLAPSHRTLAQAERDGTVYARACGADAPGQLRALPVETVLAGSAADDPRIPGTPPPPLFRPVVDGAVLPDTYAGVLAAGTQNDVPLLLGNNRDESGAGPGVKLTVAEYERRAAGRYGDFAAEFLTLYPVTTDTAASAQHTAARADSARTSTHLWAQEWANGTESPVFTHFWTRTPPGPEGAARGAFHGSEIPYLLGSLHALDRPWAEEDRQTSTLLTAYLVNFATNGDPNGPDLPAWPTTRSDRPEVFETGHGWAPIPLAEPARTDFHRRFLRARTTTW